MSNQPDETLLCELKWNDGELVSKAPHVEITCNMRIYYRLANCCEDEQSGFDFYVAEWTGSNSSDHFADASATVERVASGVAFFDGIRHITFGDDTGYMHYMNCLDMARLFTEMASLVRLHCFDAGELESHMGTVKGLDLIHEKAKSESPSEIIIPDVFSLFSDAKP